jgi:hypothetical protein
MEFSYGGSLQLEHGNPPALLLQDSPIHSERTLVHKQPQYPWRSTNTVLSEINKCNTKYLRKLENHTNALAVNLVDNS